MAPSDPNLLLTTGPGGVLRSDDGGQTWFAHILNLTGSPGWPTALAMAPSRSVTPTATQPQSVTVYTAVDVGDDDSRRQTVFRSDDGGLTWRPQAWLTETHRLMALAVHPADSDIVCGGGAGLYQSGDGGATWTLLSSEITVRALTIVPGDTWLLYAITDEGVARSDDGGLTWAVICFSGQANGPAEFLGITITPVESFDYAQDKPYPVILLARPTQSELDLTSAGTCWGSTTPRYDLRQGWQQSSEGLPVFIQEVQSYD